MAELGSPRPGRCAALVAGAAAAFLGTTHLVHAVPAAVGFGPALTWLAGWVLLVSCGWAALAASVLLVAAVRGPDLLRWCCPRRWRPVVLAAAGAAVAAGALTPAHAEGWHPPSLTRPTDRLLGPAHGTGHLGARSQGGPASPTTVVVLPGDSLWRIAARHRPGADDAAVATTVEALYRLNRGVIGADPDLLHPGVRLQLPTSQHDERSPR
ncbi:MAG: LysM peptidoglycan-binding domain-containing protein [Marmoricola sp.]